MKYNRFEELPVWNAAINLGDRIYRLTDDRYFKRPGDLCDQLRRAALSISNNIAEGFERGTTAELLMYLYIARGSAGEVRSMLHFCDRRLASPASNGTNSEISNLKSEISNLRALAESCSRQHRAWAEQLQNCDIKGQRHLSDKSKSAFDDEQRRSAFWRRLEAEHEQRVAEWSRRTREQTDSTQLENSSSVRT